MKIEYSEHIKNRIVLRKIGPDLPRQIIENAINRYFDHETGYMIAVMEVQLYNHLRDVMVAYTIEEDIVVAITIHPLKEGQREGRVKSGRWSQINGFI